MGILNFVLFSLFVCAPAQAAAPDVASSLVVSNHQWGAVTGRTVITDRGSVTIPPYTRLPRRRPGEPPWKIIVQREAYILVKNVGTREVKGLKWVYVFYDDAKHQREVGRFEFRSKDSIKPGEMKFINEVVQQAAPTPYDDVFVESVELADAKK